MAQDHSTTANTSSRVISDEDYNGLTICNRNVSTELLTEIFCNADHGTLLNCQLVCKYWRTVIQNYVWWKKAGLALGKPFPRYEKIPWHVFYFICKTKPPFERNLLKNHSGEELDNNWNILSDGSSRWTVENPPIGVPELPLTEPIFEGKQYCFAMAFYNFSYREIVGGFGLKKQVVDLVAEGFHPHILDVLQPPIVISEWYSCQNGYSAIYECLIELLGVEEKDNAVKVLDLFRFSDAIKGERQNKWQYISRIFTNYGRGLRKITFIDSGMGNSPPGERYWGTKMAGACIRIKIPQVATHMMMQRFTTNPKCTEILL
ncbi:F-box only protein 44-like [Formica exsecta]|uniref:F-box only protein 44-like n=1 Tax=Formica exsecta TaxID=72781 RepID=UPI001144B23B|nr:F-box only protein 44-like [Formica exsecta]